jgi:glycosyltransferase involved in cell wall biosynthesis
MRRGEDLAAHYASADVFVFPSTTETFGNVTTEAMASGLAIVAYDYAAAREHLRHWVSGMLAPLGDASEFARMATLLAKGPKLRARLGLEARRTAETITWDKVLDDFEIVLRRTAATSHQFSGPAGTSIDVET